MITQVWLHQAQLTINQLQPNSISYILLNTRMKPSFRAGF